MSLHRGSAQIAHNLDRFGFSNFELIAGEAARLGVSAEAVRDYLDLYGDEVLPVRQVRMVSFTPRRYSVTQIEMPAYEARIRQDVLGERLAIRQ
jgi:hypothetical protein